MLRTDDVPLWAAHWLAEGLDGEATAEVAGLSGTDTGGIIDLLPIALEDAGVAHLATERSAAAAEVFGEIAALHVDARGSWGWVIDSVDAALRQSNRASEFDAQPLAAVQGWNDQPREIRGRAEEEVSRIVRSHCLRQLGRA